MTVSLTPTQIAAALRLRVLKLGPTEIGICESECPKVWGVVIETAHPDAVASLIALADGSVSVYVSDGTGCIGCGMQREIRFAASELLQIAAKILPLAAPSDDLSLPPEGHVRCNLLTPNGIHSIQVKLEDINRMAANVGVLYFGAQRVISAIERVGAGQSLAHEMKLAIKSLESAQASSELPESASPSLKPSSVQDESSASSEYSATQGAAQCLSVGNVVLRLRT